jgi:hypothetical protein
MCLVLEQHNYRGFWRFKGLSRCWCLGWLTVRHLPLAWDEYADRIRRDARRRLAAMVSRDVMDEPVE